MKDYRIGDEVDVIRDGVWRTGRVVKIKSGKLHVKLASPPGETVRRPPAEVGAPRRGSREGQ